MLRVKSDISIACNGIKPKTSKVFLLAAELADQRGDASIKDTIKLAMKCFDYDGYECADGYAYDYGYADGYNQHRKNEKVIALLFLAAIYESQGE